MKEKFVSSSINFIQKYEECDELKLKKLKYGLEGIYGTFVKLIVVLAISGILKTFKETGILIIFYAGIRTFSYGLHAKNSIACWISTITVYNIIPFLMKNLTISNTIGYIILGLSLISVILWSPADTPKKPLIRKNNRLKCKILSCATVILYTIIFVLNNDTLINNAIIYALLIESVLINPLTYKLTKTTFNNYKHYHKKPTTMV